MNLKTITKLIPAILLSLLTSCSPGPYFIDSQDDKITYTGRINFEDTSAPEIYWGGTSIKIRVTGGNVKALLKDEKGEYVKVILGRDRLLIRKVTIS